MKEQPDFGIRSAIKTSRDIKKQSRENNTFVRGRRGKNIEQVQAQVSHTLSALLEENQDWVNEQKNKIKGIVHDIDEQEVFSAFETGLMTFFKQQYRVFTQEQKDLKNIEIPDSLKNKEYIKQQIIAYTFDFIQLLKKSIKEGMTSSQSLQIASLAYRHNPDVFKDLAKKHPNVNEIVINSAIILHPANPEKFISYYLEKVRELSSSYPDLDDWVINFVALHHTSNPEGVIERFLKIVPELQTKYPNIRLTAIKQAALQPKPDKFIENFKSGQDSNGL